MNIIFNIFFAIFVILFSFGILIIIHELGHFLAAKQAGVGVTTFSFGLWKKIWGFKRGETEYRISALPIGGYVKLMGLESEADDPAKSYVNKPKLVRLRILAAGCVFNLLLAIIMLTCLSMYGIQQVKPTVNPVKGFPAAEVIIDGDEIREVNGIEVTHWREISAELNKHFKEFSNSPVRLTILREGVEKEVEIIPVKVESEDEFGAKVKRWQIGIISTGEIFMAPGMSLGRSFLRSIQGSSNAYVQTYLAIYKLFAGKAKAKKSLMGPVGISVLMVKAAEAGLYEYFSFLAILSLILCIMNSLPVPFFDGGHMMFLGLEAIRRKPLSDKTTIIIQTIFIQLLVLLFAYVLFIDILRFM